MSLIPFRYHCPKCAGYIGSSAPALACLCPDPEAPALGLAEKALDLFGEPLAEHLARRERFIQRGYC